MKGNEAYLLTNSRLNGVEAQRPYPFSAVMSYYDQRFADGSAEDLAAGARKALSAK